MSKSVGTFRAKWQASKKLVPSDLLKDLDLSKGLGPATDEFEKALGKALELHKKEKANAPKDAEDSKELAKLKAKVKSTIDEVYKIMAKYVVKLKAAQDEHPEHGNAWFALHHAMYKFTGDLKPDVVLTLGVKRPSDTFFDDTYFKRTAPEVEQDEGPARTRRNTGFDLKKNQVHNKDKQGPHEPDPEKAPQKGILKKEGAGRRQEFEDHEIPDGEEAENQKMVYDKFLDEVKSKRQDPAALWLLWKRQGIVRLGGSEGKTRRNQFVRFAGDAEGCWAQFAEALKKKPFDHDLATAKFEAYKKSIQDVVGFFPQRFSDLRKETGKMITTAQDALTSAQLGAREGL